MSLILASSDMSLVELSPETPGDREHVRMLVSKLREGDGDVHASVLRALIPLVRRWCYRVLGPRSDLDDAVQDALAEISTALPRFEGRASLTTLAYRITIRRAVRFRSRQRMPHADSFHEDQEPTDRGESDPERIAIAKQSIRRLYELIDRPPPARRIAFVLCAIESLSPAEAADVIGTSSLAVRVRLHHARRSMTEWMREDELLADYVREEAES